MNYDKMTIDKLIEEAKQRRSIKHPFKAVLIKYLKELDKIKEESECK